jgi:hypothetical protein
MGLCSIDSSTIGIVPDLALRIIRDFRTSVFERVEVLVRRRMISNPGKPTYLGVRNQIDAEPSRKNRQLLQDRRAKAALAVS